MAPHTFRKGDRVVIEAVVDFVLEGNIKIVFDGLGSNAYVSPDALELIMPIFRPGERVVHTEVGAGEVVAIHDDMAWVKLDDGSLETLLASDLRMEPGEAAGTPPPSLPLTYSDPAIEEPEVEF
jgi:hypothetical protein